MRWRTPIAVLVLLAGGSCSDGSGGGNEAVVEYGVEVVAEYLHDSEAFTQGLAFHNGQLYESTGLYGESDIREVALATGRIERKVDLEDRYFGEGLTVIGDRVLQLTWRENTGFVWDRDTFEQRDTFTYPTEGWGLADDEERLIMSDGTAFLYFLDPETYERTGSVEVRDEDGPVNRLNELEVIGGEVWANVWQTDTIVIIDPATGAVTGRVDLTGLLDLPEQPGDANGVLNGIAYDPTADRIVVTGKLWPRLFEIRLVPRSATYLVR